MFLDEYYVPPLGKAAVDHVCGMINDIHTGDMPNAFYIAYMATRLILSLSNQVKPCCAVTSTLVRLGVILLDKADDFMVASVEDENGYSEIKRKSILDAMWECTDLKCTFYFFHKIIPIKSCIGLEGGAHALDAPFTCNEGVQQGIVEASFIFCLGTNKANKGTHHKMMETRGGLCTGMDGTYLIGQPDAAVSGVHS
eukprot:6172187-Ditylum_brightwellii.AAC.1